MQKNIEDILMKRIKHLKITPIQEFNNTITSCYVVYPISFQIFFGTGI